MQCNFQLKLLIFKHGTNKQGSEKANTNTVGNSEWRALETFLSIGKLARQKAISGVSRMNERLVRQKLILV